MLADAPLLLFKIIHLSPSTKPKKPTIVKFNQRAENEYYDAIDELNNEKSFKNIEIPFISLLWVDVEQKRAF